MSLVWLCETKIQRKSKIVLHGYRYLYNLHKNRRHLRRQWKRCWDKVCYFKLWIRPTGLMDWINKRWIMWKNNDRVFHIDTKTCSFLSDNSDENKKAKGTRKCVIKQKIKFEDYKHCLGAT